MIRLRYTENSCKNLLLVCLKSWHPDYLNLENISKKWICIACKNKKKLKKKKEKAKLKKLSIKDQKKDSKKTIKLRPNEFFNINSNFQ